RDDMHGARQRRRAHALRDATANVDAMLQQALDHIRRHLGIGLRARRRCRKRDAPGACETPHMLGGDQALCRAMQADEGYGLRFAHESSVSMMRQRPMRRRRCEARWAMSLSALAQRTASMNT